MSRERSIIDDVLELVEQEKWEGRRYLDLPPAALDALARLARRSAPPRKTAGADSATLRTPQQRPEPRPLGPVPSRRPQRDSSQSLSPDPGPAATPVEAMTWEELEAAVARCRHCPLWRTRRKIVFGEGDKNADLVFVGEGPGFEEDRQGKPFVGPAGQLLTRMIEAMQFRRDQVYIANVVKCRPPGNRNPRPDEAQACLPYLYRQIMLIRPKVIVLLGNVPLQYLLGKSGILRQHGQWQEFHGIPVLPTFHPAFLLRSPQRKRDAWEDLQKVMLRLGKDPGKTVRKKRGG